MTPEDIFRRIIGALDQAGIPYMLTGSFASSYHGTPRATQDIDLVIAPTPSQVRHLVTLLPQTEYYISESAALEALSGETQFNVIDFATGWKIDLIIRKSRPFSRSEFDRRLPVDLFGIQLFIASAEDVVVAKLEWGKAGQSMRQLEDSANILRAGWGELDHSYITHWVDQLGLGEQWEQARKMAGVG
jgi:hypothetical protein